MQDIFEIRMEKLAKIMKAIEPDTPVKFISNAGAVEINAIRPAFVNYYATVGKMQNVIEKTGL